MPQPPVPGRTSRPNSYPTPAPLTVWPAPSTADPTSADDGGLSAAAVGRLICTYTRPGDLVVALHHQLPVAEAADWFSRRAALIVTHSNDHDELAYAIHDRLTPTRRGAVRILAVRPHQRAKLLCAAPATAGLILARLPEDPSDAADLQSLITASARCLRPGGSLCVTVAGANEAGRFVDHTTQTITLARSAGLTYHQHLVALREHLHEVPIEPVDAALLPAESGAVHRRAHTDLYVFTTPGGVHA